MELEQYYDGIILVLIVVSVMLLILTITLMVRLGKLSKRYRRIVGNSSYENVDELIMEMQARVERLETSGKHQADTLVDIRNMMKRMKAHVAVSRYNAFSKQGNDLSFSIAILDEDQNGVVLTGIHSREESYIYAKPIEMGNSTYALSPEEKDVISRTKADAAKRLVALP